MDGESSARLRGEAASRVEEGIVNRLLAFGLVVFALIAFPGVSAAQTDCQDVPSRYSVVIHRLPDGHYAMFQKYFFNRHHQPRNHSMLWELESPDPEDRAVIDFGSSTPFSAAQFECRPHQAACSGLPVANEGATEFPYTITVHPKNGVTQTVDPGIIIDGPAMVVPWWKIFVY